MTITGARALAVWRHETPGHVVYAAKSEIRHGGAAKGSTGIVGEEG